ncbi:helix-turn-helix domain-containing protein [Staphylococcus aureus]|uniref:helix-turn-helix domain-containing protein n=1 Tax=Staphylococcus aureus TaxID=1280 RepID=UPI003F441092
MKRRREPYMDLKKYMLENSIRQKDLAKALKKSPSAINQNLNGTGGDFSLNEARVLSNDFAIPIEYFFSIEVPKTEIKQEA